MLTIPCEGRQRYLPALLICATLAVGVVLSASASAKEYRSASVKREFHCRAAAVAIRSKLRRPYRTLRLGLIAVALEHQVGDAPDVDFRDHTRQAIGRTSICR
jgi:hypothetical protein